MTVPTINVAPFGLPKSGFPQLNRHAGSAPSTPSENTSSGDPEATRTAADARVEQDYLKQPSAGSRVPVPPESTLGRWVEALRFAAHSSAFRQLENLLGGHGAFTHLDHTKGEIWFDSGRKKITRDSPEIKDIPGGQALFDNLMTIAKKLAPSGTLRREDVYELAGSGRSHTVDSNLVRQFIYGPGPNMLPDSQVPVDILSKTGEAETHHNLLAALKKHIETPGAKPDLESIVVEIAPHSVFWREDQPQPVTMNLKQLMAAYGLQVPTTQEALVNLEHVLFAAPLCTPPEGDFGGLLTKDVPLGEDARKKISETVSAWKALQTQVPLGAEGKAPSLFEYLKRAVPASGRALADTDPEAFLKVLINTPQARALGKQLQEAIGALPTATSALEALLTALGLEVNPSSAGVERNNLAGYNLRQPDNVGRTPAEIVTRFETHMEGIVGPEMAKVAAYQLLAMSAPEFLVKDVPDSVVFGSQQWVVFSAEVFRREQNTAGSSAGKRYDQIREQGSLEPVTREQAYQAKAAVLQAVIDWGVAKNIIKANSEGYSEQAIASVTAAMEQETKRLAATLEGVLAPLPTRRDLALEALTKVFGEEHAHLFEKKIFSRRTGLHTSKTSLVELYMSGTLHPRFGWTSKRPEFSREVILASVNQLPDIKKKFVEGFDAYADSFSKAAGEMFLHQVSQLPSEDRKRLEFGRIEMQHLSQATFSKFPEDSENNPLFQMFGVGAFFIKTLYKGERVDFIYSPQLGKIIKNGDPLPGVPEGWNIKSERLSGTGLVVEGERYALKPIWSYIGAPEMPEPHTLTQKNTPSARMSTLAKQLSDDYKTAVDNLKSAANGMTDSEKSHARSHLVKNFLLSLLPFHDLVKNIIEGNKHDAVVNGIYDFIGLFNPAAKGGFKAVNVGAKGVSSVLTFLKGAARAGLKEGIPFKGFYDVGTGLFKVGNSALKAAPSVDLASFRDKFYRPGRGWNAPHGGGKQTIADGTYRPLDKTGSDVPVVAVKQGSKWYAIDPQTLKPYGPALNDFTPITVKELRDLRYDTATAIKDSDGHIETAGEFKENESGPTPPQQPSALQAAR
ncbi:MULTISPECIES: hypothetical protein [unclassified Pseudomonas]|uniref:hypothetical protein n=1 Tax=unclassified Pseudomonas TaxID=196821 RepID=UPI0009E973BE|nr:MULTISPECIES: hypothetical protein [unclassified Pseudomonas]